MRSVALLLFGLHLAFAGRHSLQYFYTVVSGHIDFPELTVVGMVDDQQYMYFDSDSMKAVPKTGWIRADYWDRQTEVQAGLYYEYRNEMHTVTKLLNQSMSGGLHALQVMYGCVMDDDGTTQAFNDFGYDGEDFISFDKNTLRYTAANPQAVTTKNKWDANRANAEHCKTYLENTCIESLKKFVSYGKDSLERKVPPEVSLLQKDSSSPVICHATSFYPSSIIMTWKKNHEEIYEDVEVGETLPNADGSYQKSISLSVNPEEWKKNPDVYRCVIQHVGAEKEIIVSLVESFVRSRAPHGVANSAFDNIILIVVGCVLALIVLTASIGLIVRRKYKECMSSNSTGYLKGSTTDADSNSDEQT